MNTLDRLKIAMKHLIGKGIARNQKGIGVLLGYKNESSFSQIVNGKVPIPNGFWNKLKGLDENLNTTWIETGDGEMLKSATDQQSKQGISILKNRINKYLDHKGITQYTCYDETGMSNGVLSKNNGISEENLLLFISYYSDISPEWLLTGRGEMIRDTASDSLPAMVIHDQMAKPNRNAQSIPMYEGLIPSTLTPLFSGQIKPSSYLNIPNLPDCDGAIMMPGDSMEPEIKRGDVIIYKKVKDLRSGLFLGQIYLVSCEIDGVEYVSVRYVDAGDDEDSLKLIPRNPKGATNTVPIDSIKAMAVVKASLRYNTMM